MKAQLSTSQLACVALMEALMSTVPALEPEAMQLPGLRTEHSWMPG